MKRFAVMVIILGGLLWLSQTAFPAEIHDAVRAGDLAKVKALVAKDPKVVNEKDARGRTPLHFASGAGNTEIVKFLIASGADVKATDPDGFTPLHWAAYEGHGDAARALIAAGADPNARGGPGVDTLGSAFYGRHPEAVEALLQGGLKVQAKGEDGRILLHRAASAGFLSLVEYLLKNGADAASPHDFGKTLLHSAAEGGLSDMVEKLVAGGADVNAADDLGQTLLHFAASGGRQDMVDFLIAKGADTKAVCRDGRSLLHCAAAGGLVELMDNLIKSGFPIDGPDRYGRTPLLKAAEAGSDKGAEFLLSRGANVMSRDYYQSTALHNAVFSGNLRLLDVLVKHGAEVDALNEERSTPLLYVTQAGREDVINWLLDHGAKLDVRNKLNETPLTFPLGNGFVELVEKLWPRAEALKNRDLFEKYPLHRVAYLGQSQAAAFVLGKGVPIDLKDESGRTPFQRAAQGGSVEIAKMLLEKGAQVDRPDPEGSTPLHLAAKKGRSDMVRFLLQNNANPKAKDGKGGNALDLAAEYGYPNIAAILKEAGAEPTPSSEKTDVPSLLAKPLRDGDAIVWSLGHCGFAVKTRTRLLIFDYFSRGGPRPEKPSLANGYIYPEEIKDQNVTVFVSHAHTDHFDSVILSWRPTIKNITYIFGWNARKGDRSIDLPAPRATTTINGMEIFTVNGEHNDVPEAAYLVKVDGLAIYHSGDYMGPIDTFRADMDYFLEKAGKIDIAFIGKFPQAESLKPRVVFPIHAYNREFMYGAFAREAAEKKLPSRVVCPENKGDRYEFVSPAAEPRQADKKDEAALAGRRPFFVSNLPRSGKGEPVFFSRAGDVYWVSAKVREESAAKGAPDKAPAAGSAHVWYLGHCGYAVRTSNHLLIFDYQEQRDGQQPKSRPDRPSLANGWIDPGEIKDLKVRVFTSHSHGDHYDPVILTWKEAVPDIVYHFGWKAADDPSHHYLIGPRAELKADGLEIATINSHHSGVPEVAWLVKVDGLFIYHNGDCRPEDPSAEHDFLRTKTDAVDLAFVFPVTAPGQKYTIQEEDFFRKFLVRAAFPMHAQAGDAMYLDFQKAFQAKFPRLAIFVPAAMGQKWVFAQGAADEEAIRALVPRTREM
ncbi:MAG: hypothetical protein HGA24_02935 [Candidatus Aminicenantes bacterium]|nr:hypothetical protein [Candidatus Aminicenantes bacterium]